MSFDIAVQRGIVDFGASAGADTEDVSITAVDDLEDAFAFLHNSQNVASGLTTADAVDKNADDLSMSCILQAVDNVRLTRLASAEDADYKGHWGLWEYIGDEGGPNEFIVREARFVILTGGTATVNHDISSLGVSDFKNLVPVCLGFMNENTSVAFDLRPTMRIDATAEEVIFERTDTTTRVAMYYALVEFTGSNWQIVQNVSHTYSSDGADENETITTIVDWDTAFIFSTHHTDQVGLNEVGWTVRPGSTVTTVRFRMRSGATIATDERTIAFVVRNAEVTVTHDDTITGSLSELASGNTDQTHTISAISNPITAADVLASADCAGGGTAHPRAHWGYELASTTTVDWRRGRSGQPSDAVIQVIEFPQRIVEADVEADAGAATVAFDADVIREIPARAAKFEGSAVSDQHLYAAHSADLSLEAETTFGAVVKLKDTSVDNPIFVKTNLAGTSFEYSLIFNATVGQFIFRARDDQDGLLLTIRSSVVATQDRWYVVLCDFSESDERITIQVFSVEENGEDEVLQVAPKNGLQAATIAGADFWVGYDPRSGGLDPADADIQQIRRWDALITGSTRDDYQNFGRGRTHLELEALGGAGAGAAWTNFVYSFELHEVDADATRTLARKDAHTSGLELLDGGGVATIDFVESTGGHRTVVAADAAVIAFTGDRLITARQSAVQFLSATPTGWLESDDSGWGMLGDSAYEIWVKIRDLTDGTILERWDSASVSDSQFRLQIDGGDLTLDYIDGGVRTQLNVGSLGSADSTSVDIPIVGIWAQIVIVFDEGTTDVVSCIVSYGGIVRRRIVSVNVTDLDFNVGAAGPIRIGRDDEASTVTNIDVQMLRHYPGIASGLISSFVDDALYDCGRGIWQVSELFSPWSNTLDRQCELSEVDPEDGIWRTVNSASLYVPAAALSLGGAGSVSSVPGTGFVACADPATVALDVDVIRQATVAVQADVATVAIDADVIRQTTMAVQADVATTAIDGTVTVPLVEGDVDAIAGAATVAFDVDVIRQTTTAVSAAPAVAAVSADEIKQTTVTVQAGAALTVFDAQKIAQTTTTVQADPATTVFSAQVRMHVTMSPQAGPATTVFDAQKISQSGAVTVSADPATTAIDADRISQTTMVVAADTAVVTIDASYVRFAAAVIVQAGAAVAVVTGQRVIQTTMTPQADAATTAIAGIKRMHVTMTPQADPATTLFDAQRISQGDVDADAGIAFVTIDADELKQTTMAVAAGAAVVAIDTDLIRQTTVTVQASASVTVFDAQKVVQTAMAVQAGAAVVVFDVDAIAQTAMAVQAGAAVTVFDADKISQTATVVQASNATATVVGEVGEGILGVVIADAGAAVTVVAAQKIHVVDVAVDAGAANTLFDAQKVLQTGTVVTADVATVTTDADKVIQSGMGVTADTATTAISTQRIEVVDAAVAADDATAAVLGQRISQTDADAVAGAAVTVFAAQKIHVVDVAVDADDATTAISGSIIQSSGVVIAVAGAALTTFDAQRVSQTDVSVSAGAAVTTIPVQRIEQVSFAVQADATTAAISVQRLLGASLTLQAGEAQVVALGQRVVQGTVGAVAGAATTVINGTAVQVTGAVAGQAGFAVSVVLGQRIPQGLLDSFAGLATTLIPSQKISQTDVAVFAGPAVTFVVGFDPARPSAPSVVFGPDVDHTVVSPSTLTIVTAHPTSHTVTRKTIDTVLVDPHETDVISPEGSLVFAPKTVHRVIFRPPR